MPFQLKGLPSSSSLENNEDVKMNRQAKEQGEESKRGFQFRHIMKMIFFTSGKE